MSDIEKIKTIAEKVANEEELTAEELDDVAGGSETVNGNCGGNCGCDQAV